MALQLYGLTTAAGARAAIADPALAAQGLDGVEALGLAALTGPAATPTARTRVLEKLLDHGPLLAAVPGASLRDEEDAQRFLAANLARLRAALNAYGDKREFQIAIAWDPVAALEDAKRRDDFGAIRRLAERGDRKALGRAIQHAMEVERAVRAERAAAMIAAAVVDLITPPRLSAETVLNAAVMVERTGEVRLGRALEAVAASWPGALSIRCTGPSPALSFASVAVDRPHPSAINAASARLGVDSGADPNRVRDAYRAMTHHRQADLAAVGAHNTSAASGAAPSDPLAAYSFMLQVSEARQALRAFDTGADGEETTSTLALAVMRREAASSAPRRAA